MLTHLIPKVFYDHLQDGLDLFVSGLGFKVLHQDDDLAVVARDGAKAYLVESPEFAAKDRPELAIETEAIDAVLDKTGVCVVFRQWATQPQAADAAP